MNEALSARCKCGQLGVACVGDPVRVSVCHCRDCQRRSGSALAAQIRFPIENVCVIGDYRSWARRFRGQRAARPALFGLRGAQTSLGRTDRRFEHHD